MTKSKSKDTRRRPVRLALTRPPTDTSPAALRAWADAALTQLRAQLTEAELPRQQKEDTDE